MKKKIKKFEKKICVMILQGGGRICPNGHFPQYKYA